MADAAQVYAVNQALFLLGQDPVADLSAAALKQSVAATKLMRVLNQSRDVALRRHGWTCALEYKTLAPAQLAGYANWRYPTVFLLPAGALRVWEIEGQCIDRWHDGGIPRWQLGTYDTEAGGTQLIVRTETLTSLNLCFVRTPNWQALDAHVLDYVAGVTAEKGCYSVTGDLAKAQALAKVAEERALIAISIDGTQEGGQPPQGYSKAAQIRAMSR